MDSWRAVVLSGLQICEAIQKGEVEFDGRIRGNSLLLTLGDQLLAWAPSTKIVEPWLEDSVKTSYAEQKNGWTSYDLPPREAVLISAREHLRLPLALGGAIGTLSHVARLGLFAHFASPFVGPAYCGHLALELLNVSPHVLRLRPTMPVAKVVLYPTAPDPDTGPFYYNSARDVRIDLRSQFYREFPRKEA